MGEREERGERITLYSVKCPNGNEQEKDPLQDAELNGGLIVGGCRIMREGMKGQQRMGENTCGSFTPSISAETKGEWPSAETRKATDNGSTEHNSHGKEHINGKEHSSSKLEDSCPAAEIADNDILPAAAEIADNGIECKLADSREKSSILWPPCAPAAANGNLEGRGEKCNSATATYYWPGLTLELPTALRLAKWCHLEDKVLEFRASNSSLQEGFRALESANLDLQYSIVDGALWVKMSSSQYTDVLLWPLAKELARWEKRNGVEDQYIVSGSSGMVYITTSPRMLIPNCCIFETRTFSARREIDAREGRVVPRDLQAEVAFECVSATDDVEKIWMKCKQHVVSNRAEIAIGICDRNDKKESEVKQDARFIGFDRDSDFISPT